MFILRIIFILMQVTLVHVKQWSDLVFSASHYLRRYREEHGENFELEISDNNLSCLVKLHRALNFTMYVQRVVYILPAYNLFALMAGA